MKGVKGKKKKGDNEKQAKRHECGCGGHKKKVPAKHHQTKIETPNKRNISIDEIEEEVKNELSFIDFTSIYLPSNAKDDENNMLRMKHKMELKKKKLLDQEEEYMSYFDNIQ